MSKSPFLQTTVGLVSMKFWLNWRIWALGVGWGRPGGMYRVNVYLGPVSIDCRDARLFGGGSL